MCARAQEACGLRRWALRWRTAGGRRRSTPAQSPAALPHRARQHSRTEPARDPRRGEIQGGGGGGRCLCGRGGGARRGLAGCFHARAWEGAGSGGGNQGVDADATILIE
ncbi:hypothetical protein Zm00014a_041573 [Zea mays]|uniref:Uncharacterized protein n=1 Tax=Zea mays TaxID=4577 RepID=A0A3L6GDK7_MAIZE|nr:hypothetical protein Zm00014a_041573 [Zea mays]